MTTAATADAALAVLAAAGVSTYERHTAPSDADPAYVVIDADLGRGETYRLSGRTTLSAHRFVVLAVGTTPNNARVVADEARAALEGVRVVPGCTPCRLESSTTVGLDDADVPDVYSGSLVFTFAIERTA